MLLLRTRLLGSLLVLASLSATARADSAPTKHAPHAAVTPISPRLLALRERLAKEPSTAVEEFWQQIRRSGTPLVEPLAPATDLVTFLWSGDASTRTVSISWTAWTFEFAKTALSRLPGTDVWFKSVRMPHDTRMSYQLQVEPVIDAPLQADPLNPLHMQTAPNQVLHLQRSVFALPGAPPERWLTTPSANAVGRLERQIWASVKLHNQRDLVVYLPVGYSPQHAPYPLLIFFDGESYLNTMSAPTLLDNLIAARAIPPLVAVFVTNATQKSRNHELPCNATFADALANELVPQLRAQYALTRQASQVAVAGASFGGLAAAFAAFRHPELFGLALCQSGSFWWNFERGSAAFDGSAEPGWLTRRFAERETLPIRFRLSAGAFERATGGLGNLEATRSFWVQLRARGYRVDYRQFSGGHDHLAWRADLPEALIALFGSSPPPP